MPTVSPVLSPTLLGRDQQVIYRGERWYVVMDVDRKINGEQAYKIRHSNNANRKETVAISELEVAPPKKEAPRVHGSIVRF